MSYDYTVFNNLHSSGTIGIDGVAGGKEKEKGWELKLKV